MAYLNVLNSNIDEPISFRKYCEQAIKQLNEIGINVMTNCRTIMIWNQVFCTNEIFSYAKYYVEMGKTEQPIFLESFPEVQMELSKFAKLNMQNLNCEVIGNHLRNNIIPQIYQTHLEECQLNNHQLSYADFFRLFHLKFISESTVWRWMKYLGFKYCKRQKNYYCDTHKDELNVALYRKKFAKNISNTNKILTMVGAFGGI